MGWHTITPACDWLDLSPVRVETDGWIFPKHRLVYDGLAARVIDGHPTVLAEGQVGTVEQDDQAWRLTLVSGEVWSVSRSSGCGSCGGGTAPIRRE